MKLFELEKFDTKPMGDGLYTLINVFRTSHHVELSKDGWIFCTMNLVTLQLEPSVLNVTQLE